MTFNELAWGAFIFKIIDGDKSYCELVIQEPLLNKLRMTPHKIESEDIKVVVDFLNSWKCRTTMTVGRRLHKFYRDELSLFRKLEGKRLDKLNDVHFQIIEKIYRGMTAKSGIKVAIAAKFLHIINPEVFMPADNPIIKKISTVFWDHKDKTDYTSSLEFAKDEINKMLQDFTRRGQGKDVVKYLNNNLGYNHPKTLAKYIDEYFWVTITKEFKLPPEWNYKIIK